MRVNMNVIKRTKKIEDLLVGSTFTAKRSDNQNIGLYMVVDDNSGLAKQNYKKTLAVNLSTGQLRSFNCYTEVEPVDAEVDITVNA